MQNVDENPSTSLEKESLSKNDNGQQIISFVTLNGLTVGSTRIKIFIKPHEGHQLTKL